MVGLMPTLTPTKEDAIFTDALNHASIIDAIRLSKAQRFIYKHRDLEQLEEMLKGATARNRLIVTDGVFSMEGDVADLPRLKELADKYDALLVVDESHATGVLGATGKGTAEHFGVLGEGNRADEHARQGAGRILRRIRRGLEDGLRLPGAEVAAAALLERPAAGGLLRLDGRDRHTHVPSRSASRSCGPTRSVSARASRTWG